MIGQIRCRGWRIYRRKFIVSHEGSGVICDIDIAIISIIIFPVNVIGRIILLIPYPPISNHSRSWIRLTWGNISSIWLKETIDTVWAVYLDILLGLNKISYIKILNQSNVCKWNITCITFWLESNLGSDQIIDILCILFSSTITTKITNLT